jgi:hypothetical protein
MNLYMGLMVYLSNVKVWGSGGRFKVFFQCFKIGLGALGTTQGLALLPRLMALVPQQNIKQPRPKWTCPPESLYLSLFHCINSKPTNQRTLAICSNKTSPLNLDTEFSASKNIPAECRLLIFFSQNCRRTILK